MAVLLTFTAEKALAQAPQGLNYQAVVRNSAGVAQISQPVGVQFKIRQGSVGGTLVYQEVFSPTTNSLGLMTLAIGQGTPQVGTFVTIDWSNSPYFLEVLIDPAGGTAYVSAGNTQFLSVPYALYSDSAGNGVSAFGGTGNTINLTLKDGSVLSYTVTGVSGPTGPQGPAGPAGPIGNTGPAGPAGATGATGSAGTPGTNGLDGKTVLNGTSNPTGGTGVNGDFYINTTTSQIFGPKAGGVWPSGVSLVGPAGATGAAGPAGPIGNTGPAGPAGATGTAGTNGLDGATWHTGTGVPSSGLGVNNDLYINTSNGDYYKKVAGTWTLQANLTGPQGPTGPAGTGLPTGTGNQTLRYSAGSSAWLATSSMLNDGVNISVGPSIVPNAAHRLFLNSSSGQDAFRVQVNGVDAFHVDDTRFVGIGTSGITTPLKQLTIQAATGTAGEIAITPGTTGGQSILSLAGQPNALTQNYIQHLWDATTKRYTISGEAGLGLIGMMYFDPPTTTTSLRTSIGVVPTSSMLTIGSTNTTTAGSGVLQVQNNSASGYAALFSSLSNVNATAIKGQSNGVAAEFVGNAGGGTKAAVVVSGGRLYLSDQDGGSAPTGIVLKGSDGACYQINVTTCPGVAPCAGGIQVTKLATCPN